MGENVSHVDGQFQCLIHRSPTSSIDINYNGASQNKNTKEKQRIQMVFVDQDKLENLSNKLQVQIKTKFTR